MTKKLFVLLLAICPFFAACGDDDNAKPYTEVDDMAFLQARLAAEGDLVYGVTVGNDGSGILYRPVKDIAEAQAEFYKLVPTGKKHPGISTGDDGQMTCTLTDAKGNVQGSITYQPRTTSSVCAEVSLSPQLSKTIRINQLRYIPYEDWPNEGNGFLKDILEQIKK